MSGSRTSGTAVGALLFLFFQALYGLTSSGNVFRVPDEFEVYFQVEHFVDAGDISVPQTMAISQQSSKTAKPSVRSRCSSEPLAAIENPTHRMVRSSRSWRCRII